MLTSSPELSENRTQRRRRHWPVIISRSNTPGAIWRAALARGSTFPSVRVTIGEAACFENLPVGPPTHPRFNEKPAELRPELPVILRHNYRAAELTLFFATENMTGKDQKPIQTTLRQGVVLWLRKSLESHTTHVQHWQHTKTAQAE